jgi:hypothetical protein
VIFRRRKGEEVPDEAESTSEAARSEGPFDADDLRVAGLLDGDVARLDLGSMLLTPREGYDIQMPVVEGSDQFAAAVYAGPESALELRAFASPRNGDLWPDVRREIAAEVTRQGGTATEVEGSFGTELKIAVTVTAPDGQRVQQASRILGITGPRWLLRATMFGRAAVEEGADAELLATVRDVVVRRGNHPAPPGDLLPLRLPPDATPTPLV